MATRNPPGRSTGGSRRPHIVGVGASAGGIEAVSRLLRQLPVDTGLSFVIIQHLAPERASQLSAVLARSTAMPVVDAENGMRPEADHVYVIPPGVEMALRDGLLVVAATAKDRKTPRSIDLFLCSLAAEEMNRAIGVVLSGTGWDGTEGLRAIRAEGGIALVEDPASAKFAGMPEHAIAAGAADRVLSIEDLARQLADLSGAAYLESSGDAGPLEDGQQELLAQVFDLVRTICGVDFSEYKSTTFRRRLARRMLLRRTETLTGYLELLHAEPAEVEALGRDILIHVTEFFRDPAAFDALAREVVPQILERHASGTPIRIWVPGCSTGEEPYSIAICLLEALGERAEATPIPIQIFATDLSGQMIERARAGIYPDSAVQSLGPERLERFFTRTEGGHRISKSIRNLCVFVRHDLTRDPPFTRLDLVSCRNVLIYFSAALQRKVLPLFHYCLNPGGFLLLGHAEAIAGFRGLFSSVDKTSKLFSKIGAARAPGASWAPGIEAKAGDGRPATSAAAAGVQRQAENLVLGRYAPPGALVDENMDVIHLRGRTAPFLELGPGQPDLNLMKLARDGLRPALRSAFDRARKEMATVRQEGIEVRNGDRVTQVDLEVIPVTGVPARERYFLVLFDKAEEESAGKPKARGQAAAAQPDDHQREIRRLREEAEATRDFLQSMLDDRQHLNDEVTASNEELVASNEELQSSNEELEAAKEELQSANEELTTVNDEMQVRNQELNQVNSDLVNLLASVDIPIVIVSGDRRVRRFTPGARALMNLIPSDLGRPLDDIRLNVEVENLDGLISEVLDTLQIKELEVVDRVGRWYRMQIRPYRTVDNKLDGAVISLTDIDRLKQAVGDATAAFDQVTAILGSIRVPLIVLDQDFSIRSANAAYYQTFAAEPDTTVGQVWFETCHGAWNSPALRSALAALLTGSRDIALEVEVEHPVGTARTVAIAGSVLRWAKDAPIFLITPVDVSERARLLHDAEEARSLAERASKGKDVFLALLSHELRAPLHTITLHADLLRAGASTDPARSLSGAEAIGRAAEAQDRIIGDLLDVSAIMAGKVAIKRRPVELQAVISAALDSIAEVAARKRIRLRLEVDPSVGPVLGDDIRLAQIVGNLLGNAVKFTPEGGEIAVTLDGGDRHARIRVIDSGQGIAGDFLPHVFDRFAQGDVSSTRSHGGLGLGLAIVRDLVRLHGGSAQADSEGLGRGATFIVELPLIGVRSSSRPDGDREEETDPRGHRALGIADLAAGAERSEFEGVKLLLIDDDAESLEVMSEILRMHGAEVHAVAHASEVIGALAEFRPDVLLCDIAMPDEDGYSLIRRIRALPSEAGGRVPAVAVTAMATRSDRHRAIAAGFQLHVAKPAQVAVLCDAVRRARGLPVPHTPSISRLP